MLARYSYPLSFTAMAAFAAFLFTVGNGTGSALAPPPLSCLPDDATLGAYWKFDTDNGAGVTPDSTLYNNAGTFMSGAVRTGSSLAPVGFINPTSLSLHSSGAYVLVSDTTGLPQAAAPRSIALWMNQDIGGNLEQAALVSMGNGATADQKFILQMGMVGADTYLFTDGVNAANNIQLTGGEIPTLGTWHHIVFTFDGLNWNYYLDGTLTKSGTFAVPILTNTNAVEIGARHDNATGTFTGYLDDVRIYNRALSAGDVAELSGGSCPLPVADLGIVKNASGSMIAGYNALYTLLVNNSGAGISSGVTVTDVIPAGVTFVPAQSDPACTQSGTTVTCPNLSIGSGGTRALTLAFAIPSSYVCATPLVNTATVDGYVTDSNPANNASTSTGTVVCSNGDLAIVKSGSGTVSRGGNALYNIVVSNLGPVSETGVTVTDIVPAGVTFVPAQSDAACTQSGGVVTCSNLTVGSGSTRTLALAFAVPSTYSCATPLVNTATVTGQTVDPNTANNSSTSNRTVNCPNTGTGTSIVVVQPSNMRGWTFHKSGSGASGTGSFVLGPLTPPYGSGSAKFTTGSDGDYLELRQTGFSGRLLSDLINLQYSTFVPTASGSSNNNTCQAPYIILTIDNSGDTDPDENGDNILYFEPCYQSGAVVRNAWQTWDAFNGQWYPGYEDSGAPRVSGPPTQTLQQYIAAHPNAKIVNSSNGRGGVRIDAGGGGAITSDDIYNTDGFKIGFNSGATIIYNFETDDRDGDGRNDTVDNCPSNSNANQADIDGDGIGNVCDPVNNTPPASSSSTTTTNGSGGGGGGGGRRGSGGGGGTGIAPGGFGGVSSSSSSSRRSTFPDVPDDSFFRDAVEQFLENGFLDPTQSNFRPGDSALRSELTKLVIETHGGILHTIPTTPSFDDVRNGTWYYEYFEDAAKRHTDEDVTPDGWVRGDSNCYGRHPCTARPNSTLLRAEAAAMIIRTFNYDPTGEAPRMSDAPTGAWYSRWMQTAADHCIIQPGSNGRGNPLGLINRAEMITMLNRAYDNLHYSNGCTTPVVRTNITSVVPISSSIIRLTFNDGIDLESAENSNSFLVSCNGNMPIQSVRRTNSTTVEIKLRESTTAGVQCRVSAVNLENEDGQEFNDSQLFFTYGTQSSSSSSRSSSSSSM